MKSTQLVRFKPDRRDADAAAAEGGAADVDDAAVSTLILYKRTV
jgi:hypothetical protein